MYCYLECRFKDYQSMPGSLFYWKIGIGRRFEGHHLIVTYGTVLVDRKAIACFKLIGYRDRPQSHNVSKQGGHRETYSFVLVKN